MRRVSILFVAAAAVAGCSSKDYSETLSVQFNPMYSGYDGVHTYQIPATIVNNAAAMITGVTWDSSDHSMVDLAPSADGNDVMITTKKAGTVTIIAHTDTAIGKVTLTIASYTPDQWAAGQTRYTSGSMESFGMGVRGMGGYVACTSCHSNNPGSPAIEHTPEQTGGFTDAQLKQIFMMGQLPASDANPLQINPMMFQSFHQWMFADDNEANGTIAYLRSLTPMAQGAIDFGGHGHGDGGMGPYGDGGFGGHHDGGMGGQGQPTDM
jgi:hypothetical protein